MDSTAPMTFTSLALIVLLVIMLVMFACHFLGPRANTWMRSNKEEKIGLSKNKLFHANGYMIQSGSEFLLSTSGSFKRFDTLDKDDYRRESSLTSSAAPQPTQQTTTPPWNLPQTESDIPPQPLRPAPAIGSQSSPKSVTFSFSHLNEISSLTSPTSHSDQGDYLRSSSLKQSTTLPQPLEAPPPRLSSSSSVTLSATAIPRPIAKRQISLQNGLSMHQQQANGGHKDSPNSSPVKANGNRYKLTRRNSSTNPFLCESAESLPEPENVSNSNKVIASNPFYQEASKTDSSGQPYMNGGQSSGLMKTEAKQNHNPCTLTQTKDSPKQQHNDTDLKSYSSKLAAAGLQKLTNNTTNPFTGLGQKFQKGPHMLQKTISEDFLFRKLGVSHLNGVVSGAAGSPGSASIGGGNTTWSFGRSLMRQDSSVSLGRRNSSQCSLNSNGGSMDGINLERAISCESVESESSLFITDLDQPYTQITGYLCVGLQYDKHSITDDGMELTVSLLEAKSLICPFSVDSLDTFVRIYLVPDQAGAMQTKVFKNSATPCYNESFNFWLHKQQQRHSLWFHLYHNGNAHTLIGEAEMEIGEMPKPITTWIPLSDSRKCNAKWGELMFSLSYLPTAERLTIVVVKGRNLKLDVESPDGRQLGIQSVFVKVYLMNNDRKVLKKRTSLKRSDRFPIFNESMIFSVPPQSLTTVQLRLTVFGAFDDNASMKIVPLGHVIAGSCAIGKGLRHWHQMLSSLRKPVAMWHVMRRATNQPIFTGGAEAVVAAMQSTALRAKRNSII